MKKKLLVTTINKEQTILSSCFEDDEFVQVNVEQKDNQSLLGNIYIGKVKNIVKNIDAAFIEIKKGIICYYSIKENQNPIFINNKKNSKLVAGDELIVQVSKEGMKTKVPSVTANFSLTGKYIVLTHGKTMLGVSNKIIQRERREQLKNSLQCYKNEDYGLIIRTNATKIDEKKIREEIKCLQTTYKQLKENGIHRTPFSLLQQAPSNYICDIRDGYAEQLDQIITDKKEIYDTIYYYLENYQPEDLGKLRFYQDDFLSLNKLYQIESKLEQALKEKVWLKSGGTLIIQPTEALTVIDVNTGKAISGKKAAGETFYQINYEAAREIVKQIRLRNLSGIIIIDFIDMKQIEKKNELMRELSSLCDKDPIKTTVVDMTPLNLVEITRKKIRKPLQEQLQLLKIH